MGRAVVSALVGRGIRVTVLSRHVQAARARVPRGVRVVAWNPSHKGAWFDELGVVDAVIHLAGEPVAQRWTATTKARIDNSRGGVTRRLVEAIAAAEKKPSLLISASAVGIYGVDRRGETLTEDSDVGEDFLAGVCKRWEGAARGAEKHGVRCVQLRFGVVLGKGGGALSQMLRPRLFVGAPIGKGDNRVSWVHRDDVVGMTLAALDSSSWRGPINCTSPYSATQRELADQIASVVDKPAIGLPESVARLAFGDMVDVLVGDSRVYPQRAVEREYPFCHARLTDALEASLAPDV